VLRHFFLSPTSPGASSDYRYPLQVQIPGRMLRMTCCINYMETYTLTPQLLEKSQDWAVYSGVLEKLIDHARAEKSCVAILYAPLKAEVYLPLASDPVQLAPTVQGVFALTLQPDGRLAKNSDRPASVADVLAGMDSGAVVMQTFAARNHSVFINPTSRFRAAVLAGQDPYMQVDSHWNSTGHAIIAEMVKQSLSQAACP
jgi:hypothetical protein